MTVFTVEMLPAYLGDSLWIEYGDPQRPHRVLIDGGLVGTADHIERRVRDVIAKEGRCHFDLAVVTHVDADHIEGIIKLLGKADLRATFDDIWYNGAHHLPVEDADPSGDFADAAPTEDDRLGGRQGEFLSALLDRRELPWNAWRSGDTVYVPSKGRLPRQVLAGGMTLTLLSPRFRELAELSPKWATEIAKVGLDKASYDEVLAALGKDRRLAPDDELLGDDGVTLDVQKLVDESVGYDHSPANGSSIAFVASFDDRHCLLAGDAHTPVLLDGLKRFRAQDGAPPSIPAFKVPHHGSKHNVHDELLEQLGCRHFLVSTNGSRFRHPDREAIARIVGGNWRPDPAKDEPVDLYFNYRTDFTACWDDPALKEEWNYRAHYPAGGDGGVRFGVPKMSR